MGPGMDAATRARMFEPFFTTKFTGRGLGLSAVHGMVRAHGGLMRVESAPGAGSTFRLLFPALKAENPISPMTSGVVPERRTGAILIVDDERLVRQMAGKALERHGYHVVLADDGRKAIEILAEDPDRISMVLLDVAMPVMNGEETLQRIRAIRSDLPVLLSSGFNEAITLQRFAKRELAGFVQKPYTAAALAESVTAVLKKNSQS